MHSKEPNPQLDRVRFSLRAEGVALGTESQLRNGLHSRGYLPHVKREGASYFVTFRLADSLPERALVKFQAERAERLRKLTAMLDARERNPRAPAPADSQERIHRDYRRQIENHLDTGAGACYLRQPEIGQLVAGAVQFFEGQRYHLDGWVVMPNHVHVALWPMPNHLLSEILMSWKGFTARQANKLLRRVGEPFWQRETFDHWIRDEEQKARICRYIRDNPVKAGLCAAAEEWPWSSAHR